MSILQASFLKERNYLAVAITHFFVDVLNNSRTLLVALLAISIGLTNAQVGIAMLLYNVGNALTQPMFGTLADRIGPRSLVIGGIGWMIAFYGFAALAPEWPALIALTFAGIGSGAFHPTGTMVASQASETNRTQATAVFFMAGQLGLFMGPVLAGLLIEQFGRIGYVALPIVAIVALISSVRWLSKSTGSSKIKQSQNEAAKASLDSIWHVILQKHTLLLAIIILTGSTVAISAITFAPKLFTEMGMAPRIVGLLSGLFMLGSAIGGVVGGTLADRFNGRSVIMFAFLLAAPFIFFYIPANNSLRFILLPLAGFFSGMPHSILVLKVQSLFPDRKAMASGIALGFAFFSGSVGSFIIGILADQIGLGITLQYTAVLLIIPVITTLFLPRT